jgi:hypothetical protein
MDCTVIVSIVVTIDPTAYRRAEPDGRDQLAECAISFSPRGA